MATLAEVKGFLLRGNSPGRHDLVVCARSAVGIAETDEALGREGAIGPAPTADRPSTEEGTRDE